MSVAALARPVRAEGHVVPHAIRRIDVGGYDLTEHMMHLLNMRGERNLSTQFVRRLKERVAFVAVGESEERVVGTYMREIDFEVRIIERPAAHSHRRSYRRRRWEGGLPS